MNDPSASSSSAFATATATEPKATEPSADQLEEYRVELTGYCYRMLGSSFEAEDAVQESMVRAWKNLDKFEGRSTLRSWLYRIATNVCLTMLDGRNKRGFPLDLGPKSTADTTIGPRRPELPWIEPIPDARAIPQTNDPAEAAELRESIRLAFVVALQHLPARQRAALILCEVLHWKADEAATFLDTSVASVNSALQRARETLAKRDDTVPEAIRLSNKDVVARYAESFERYDMDALVKVLHEDVVMSMPPYEMWLQGASQVREWMLGQGHGCEGSRMLPIQINGVAGFAQYRRNPDGSYFPWALVILDTSDDCVVSITSFVDTDKFFPMFDLPDHLDNDERESVRS